MPKNVTQYNVLIASPSDVLNERHIIRQTMHDWNSCVGQTLGVSLEPIMWETHATPEMGDRPQAIINRQIVDDCDVLVGVFWTRIGSPTGVAMSGTAEEINLFIEAKKPALIYFSSVPINPNAIDIEQYQKVLEFKAISEAKGLYGEFGTLEDFRFKLHSDLTRIITHLPRTVPISQGGSFKADPIAEEPRLDRAECNTKPNRIPLEALSKEDIRFWTAKATRHLIDLGVPSFGGEAVKSVAQGLYREATRTTEDLRQEFLSGQRAAMRQNKGSDDVRKAASRMPKEGSK